MCGFYDALVQSCHMQSLPNTFPVTGLGEEDALCLVEGLCKNHSARLDAPIALAHMDPPTPHIAHALAGLGASLNQNLLHPDLSPFATKAESRVLDWMCDAFGMAAGHMCGGSTLGNLEAIWAAREYGCTSVVASEEAHISVPKAAHILGMRYDPRPVDRHGRIDLSSGIGENVCLVLTAGTTGRGSIDTLFAKGLWTHVDAAWAGPLIFTRYANRLSGIHKADSVVVSAHKWLYQPKDSALVMFKRKESLKTVSFGSSYLASPNVGVQGSRSAAAVPLLGTLLAWGQTGLAQRIEDGMQMSEKLADWLNAKEGVECLQRPESGVLNWRIIGKDMERIISRLGPTTSMFRVNGEPWGRQVAANPYADLEQVKQRIYTAIAA